MNTRFVLVSVSALITLTGCSATETPDATSEADAFAARINGETPAQASTSIASPDQAYAPPPPITAPPRTNAAPGAFAPGTATDPASATCNANKMGPFMGRLADEATRANILSAASGAADVRFIEAGSLNIRPDSSNPRLNIMLDVQGIIRDARCG
ncbi:MAG: hypothetical protein ABJN35_05345 [Erythrobacter sp.]